MIDKQVSAQIQALQEQVARLERPLNDTPRFQYDPAEYDKRISPAENIKLVTNAAAGTNTKVIITFIHPHDPNIDRFEVWVSYLVDSRPEPHLAVAVKDSPASFIVSSTASVDAVAYVRTVMRNGLISGFAHCPTITFVT